MRPQTLHLGGAAFLCLLALTACDSESSEPAADPAPAGCEISDPGAQPTDRFPVGSTLWLPAPGAECAHSWSLESAPAGADNAPQLGADGYVRFTPAVPGAYVLQLGERRLDLTVVPVAPETFSHVNYYGTSSQALVDGELWVAHVYNPVVERLDPATLAPLGHIDVGPWPVSLAWAPGMSHALIAHRGGDTLGLVDVASGTLEDAVWVGDEPAQVLVSPDGARAYVSLATDAAVAVVDLATREVVTRVPALTDANALALSPDGSRLYVASRRSGQPQRYPYEDDPTDAERDIALIDTESLQVERYFLDVGTTLGGLLVSPDGATLWVAGLDNDTVVDLGDSDQPSFMHRVLALDATTGEVQASADLLRQPSSGGHAVSLHALALAGDLLWVAAEGSDLAVALDPDSLAEVARADAPGRPRHVLADGTDVLVHGAQGFEITRVTAEGALAAAATLEAASDPRDPAVAAGQAYFTGAGRQYGANWSCNSCHLDGLTDTLVWNAGPFSDRVVSRPFFWLEGTYPLGWAGYLSSVRNYAFTVNTNIGIRPNTDEAENLSAYLSALMPPPAATGLTERDGSLSEAGAAGKPLFDQQCASCHPAPLSTSRQSFAQGITEGVSDVPALVGAYRHATWLKHGESTTLDAAVQAASEAFGGGLDQAQLDQLTRYVAELTARDFFVLTPYPRAGATSVRIDVAPRLVFSGPVWDTPENLARVSLQTDAGDPVPASVSAEGHRVTLTPDAPLAHGAAYQIVIDPAFEAADQRTLFAQAPFTFTTGAAPAFTLEGDYRWTVDMPVPDFENLGFDPSTTIAVTTPFTATATAAGASDLVVDFSEGLLYATHGVVDGSTLNVPPVPVPVGPSFADTTGLSAEAFDDDGDGVLDRAEGTLTISGPGFVVSNITWQLGRPGPVDACEEGPSGDVALTLERDAEGVPTVSWDDSAAGMALGLYVTDTEAQLPLGPGPVTGGETYWAVATTAFPDGFGGPVTYGVVPEGAQDDSATHGAPEGGATLEPGECYRIGVITNQFNFGYYTLRY